MNAGFDDDSFDVEDFADKENSSVRARIAEIKEGKKKNLDRTAGGKTGEVRKEPKKEDRFDEYGYDKNGLADVACAKFLASKKIKD